MDEKTGTGPVVFSNECWLLTCLLQNPDDQRVEEVMDLLIYSDFGDDRTRKVFSAMQDVFGSGQSPDPAAVAVFLASKGQGHLKDFLVELLGTFAPGGVESLVPYAKKVLDASHLRQAFRLLDNAMLSIQSGTKRAETVYSDLQSGFDRLFRGSAGDIEMYGPGDISARRLEGLRRREVVPLWTTGWPDLDQHLVAPFNPGSIVIIKGPEKSGKSTVKAGLNINFQHQDMVGACFEPEQGFDGEADRYDSYQTGVPLSDLKRWASWPKDDPRREVIREVNDYWDHCKLYRLPSHSMSLVQVRAALRRIKDEQGRVDFVTLDLFDRLEDLQVTDNLPALTKKKLREAAVIAEEFQCCMILLVQENEEGKTKWARAYQEYASLILEVDRPKLKDPSYATDHLIVRVYLQRNGPSGGEAKFIVDGASLKLIPDSQFYTTEETHDDAPVRGAGKSGRSDGQKSEGRPSVQEAVVDVPQVPDEVVGGPDDRPRRRSRTSADAPVGSG